MGQGAGCRGLSAQVRRRSPGAAAHLWAGLWAEQPVVLKSGGIAGVFLGMMAETPVELKIIRCYTILSGGSSAGLGSGKSGGARPNAKWNI